MARLLPDNFPSQALECGVELARGRLPSLFSCVPPAYLGVLCLARGAWEDTFRRLTDAVYAAQRVGSSEILRYAHCWLAEQDVLRGRARLSAALAIFRRLEASKDAEQTERVFREFDRC